MDELQIIEVEITDPNDTFIIYWDIDTMEIPIITPKGVTYAD